MLFTIVFEYGIGIVVCPLKELYEMYAKEALVTIIRFDGTLMVLNSNVLRRMF